MQLRTTRLATSLALLCSGLFSNSGVGGQPAARDGQGKLPEMASAVKQLIEGQADELERLYKRLHTHPELSLQEEKTSSLMAEELKRLGFEVRGNVGGYGVVGILRNGPRPVVLVRTDMDALPVEERTGLPYASHVHARDRAGREVPVMHACGHDMHMTCWTGTARVLAALKDRWRGTLVFIAQPAEEIGAGARMMLDAGLLRAIPRPDYALALHCDARSEYGTVTFTEGLAMANVDSVNVTVFGKGGHGAAPHTTVDPVVLAARIVLDLQTIVSREVNPADPAVVTVGSIHGGTKHNIIPSEVRLQLTVRTTKDSVRKQVLDAITRIAQADAAAARARAPEVKVVAEEFTPALLNDPALTRRTVGVFRSILGPDKVYERPPVMGGEDFGRFGRAGLPIFLYWLGTVEPERVTASQRQGGTALPSLHSDQYRPVPGPSLRTGVLTMSMAVLNLLGK